MTRPSLAWLPLLLLMPVLAVACSVPAVMDLFATATPTPTSTPSPTPTPTATPTPTPTPLPTIPMVDAERALLYGDWDLALSLFQGVLTAQDAAVRGYAQLKIGTTYVRAGRNAEAIQALTAYLEYFPEDPSSWQGWFLRAQAYEHLGQDELTLMDYERYLALRPGKIDAYVQEWMGDALRRLGRPLEAVAKYQAAIETPSLLNPTALPFKLGLAYSETGNHQAALQQFDQIFAASGDGGIKATANLLAGRELEAMGDLEGAYARYLDSVLNYPSSYDAYSGLIKLVEAGVPVDEFQRGLVDYNAGALEPALAAFDRYLAQTPDGKGFYYRGLTKRALGDATGARQDLSTVVESFPQEPRHADAWLAKAELEWEDLDMAAEAVDSYLGFVEVYAASPSAPDALFAAGRIAERTNDLLQAAGIWIRLPAEYPGTVMAFHGAFESGIVRYRMGDYSGALQGFMLAQQAAMDSSLLAKALLWQGKAQQKLGDVSAATLAWRSAAAADPTGYYSLRAQDLLAGREPFSMSGVADFSTDPQAEREDAEAWLRATFAITGPDPLAELDQRLRDDPRMVRGEELWQLGLFGAARAELETLRGAENQDPEATYRLMHAFLDLGLHRSAILSSRQILRLAGMDDAASLQAPVYFNHIRFGPYVADLILPEAGRHGLNPLLVFSLVRQESYFEAFATSYADARGLMQVIPATGREIAGKLGWPADYADTDLYRPFVSVRYGTYYLAEQRDRFQEDLFAALAAYNAGPGNARIWKDMAPDDPDLYLEVIRLVQPHKYIRAIYEVFCIYRDLYAQL